MNVVKQIFVSLVNCHWFHTLNHRPFQVIGKQAKKGALPGLYESLRDRGWKPDETITVESFERGYEIPGGEFTAADAVKERQALVEAWEKDKQTLHVAVAMRKLWTNKAGEWIEPLYMGHTGHQRSGTLPYLFTDPDSVSEFTQIPAIEVAFTDNLERLEFQILENTGRNLDGVRDIASWKDRITVVRSMAAAGAGRPKIVALGIAGLKDGTIQKIQYAIKLSDLSAADAYAKGWPSFIERCSMDEPTTENRRYVAGGWVPLSPKSHADLKAVLDVYSFDKLEEYAQSLFSDEGNASKVLSRAKWEALSAEAGSPFAAIREVHLSAGSFAGVVQRYPELFTVRYVGSIADAPAETPKAEKPARSVRKPQAAGGHKRGSK